MAIATCTLCEAACGILVDESTGAVRGDPDDPMSRGYVCPKVVGMQDLHTDPDRLRTPLIREGAGLREATWDEALDRAASMLRAVRSKHGPNALAAYQGNPTAHNLGLMTIAQAVLRTLGTKNLYSASTADQVPHMRAAHEMFGHVLFMPVPDVDRTEHMLILGANPLVSNGSIMTAPDFKRRMTGIRERGGKVVVVDPRRTETARAADEHVFIRPGTDAGFLLALIHTVFEEGLARKSSIVRGEDALRDAARAFAPEAMAATGIDALTIRRLAREFAARDRAVAYGRIGVCHQEHGTLAAWLVYALNAITGNVDREGGMMWTTPAAELVWIADLFGLHSHGRFKSRVRGAAELGSELPIAVLAEEIETPGRDQVRALITSAGNPVLSAPNGRRLERALPQLEAMVCIDTYLNETTRHAHVILPPVSQLQRSHYDLALNAFAVRNCAKYVPPPLSRGANERDDAEIFLELGLRLRAPGLQRLGRFLKPELILDMLLRAGPHRLSLKKLREHPHGLDLGALQPRMPKMLRTKSKKIEVAPPAFLAELPALASSLANPPELVLIGRRHLRSNNSWMHNTARLIKGRDRCTLLVHPRDAEARGLTEGALCEITTARGTVTMPVEITDEMMPCVVSAPHGFGHDRKGTRTQVASAHAGASINDVTDEERLDRLTGNAAFSGQPVTIRRATKQDSPTAGAPIHTSGTSPQ
jgi:anaerobic selenocysteine-containing dehydrogenase